MKNFGSSAEHGEKSCIFAAESCRSGRTGQTRNLLNPSGFRGFESLTFRMRKRAAEGRPFCIPSRRCPLASKRRDGMQKAIAQQCLFLHARTPAAAEGIYNPVARLRAKGVAECKKPLRSNALFRMQGRPRRRKGYSIPLPACAQKAKFFDIAKKIVFLPKF